MQSSENLDENVRAERQNRADNDLVERLFASSGGRFHVELAANSLCCQPLRFAAQQPADDGACGLSSILRFGFLYPQLFDTESFDTGWWLRY